MQAAPQVDPVLDSEWRSLERRLRRARDFCLIVYFVEDRRASASLEARLREVLQQRDEDLIRVAVDSPAALVDGTLGGIFGAAQTMSDRQRRAVVWVEAYRGGGDPAWQRSRAELLMRMNERRGRFESELRCPLVLLLPDGSQREAATLAPDLWHIRLHSAVLKGRPTERRFDNEDGGSGRVDRGDKPSNPGAVAASPKAPEEADFWQASVDAAKADTGKQLTLWDGFAAVDAWLAIGGTAQAQQTAREVLALARREVSRTRGDDGFWRYVADRDLAVALTKVGDAGCADGNPEAALAAYRESLAVFRTLRDDRRDGPHALRDLSITLNKVGSAERKVGNGDAALAAYNESVSLCRQRRELLGDTPEVLRDLSAALDGVGKAEWERGRNEAALAAHRESLGVCRRLREALGDDPQVLRDLSIALNNVGDAEREAGRGEAALAAYSEGVALRRQLRDMLGDAPQVLDELASSLERVAASGGADAADASAAAEEAVALREQLVAARPGSKWHLERLNGARTLHEATVRDNAGRLP